MIILGLTGGIGCGKSTVGSLLARRGVPVVDADRVARDVVLPGTEGLAEITRAFGTEVLSPDGTLDRKKLAARVFSDEPARHTLNAILHPRIAAESAARFARHGEEGHGFALYEAALLVETGAHRAMGGLVVVTAREEVQVARTVARDASTVDEARARIRSQLPLAQKVAEATYVIDNSTTRGRLEARTNELYALLVVLHGPPVYPAGRGG